MTDVDADRLEQTLNRFHRLLRELERGSIVRNTFEPWEIELLVDLEKTELRGVRRWSILRQYRAAGDKCIAGGSTPLKFSEFLAQREEMRQRRNQRCNTRRP